MSHDNFESRLTYLETKDDQRDADITGLKCTMASLSKDIASIKHALWLLAGLVGSNVPFIQEFVKRIL